MCFLKNSLSLFICVFVCFQRKKRKGKKEMR